MNNISVKTRITFWYVSLMIILVVFFLSIIFYISENLIINSEHNNLKNTVNKSFDKIVFYDNELEIDRDLNVYINNVHISIFDEDKKFIYGDFPLNFKFDDYFSENKKVKIVKRGNKMVYLRCKEKL